MYDIRFPGFGITLNNVKDGITLFGLDIKFYGIVITIGFMVAYFMSVSYAKKTGQDEELYLDFLLWLVIPAIAGARLYYVIFSWDEYFVKGKGFGQTLLDIINIRNGGLAIYGGIIAGVIVAIFFVKKKKANIWVMADTIAPGLLAAQAIGRFGNFFNREAFGEYTDSIFRMCIPVDYYVNEGSLYSHVNTGVITEKMANNLVEYDAMSWISVHPTFLYESLWNVMILVFILIYRKHKKFDGELGLIYVWGYGLGRVWIEGLRSDSLMIAGINMKASQLLAAVCVLVASIILVKKRLDFGKNISEKK